MRKVHADGNEIFRRRIVIDTAVVLIAANGCGRTDLRELQIRNAVQPAAEDRIHVLAGGARERSYIDSTRNLLARASSETAGTRRTQHVLNARRDTGRLKNLSAHATRTHADARFKISPTL